MNSIWRHNLVQPKELLGEKIDYSYIFISSHWFFYFLPLASQFWPLVLQGSETEFSVESCMTPTGFALTLKTIDMGNLVSFFPTINTPPISLAFSCSPHFQIATFISYPDL